ncbi:hypothetical protein GCM10007385_25000 [Tateyamaria omphalii]|nr:hypothetical protein GCM10007385_25000 [Tateyamaria omphalii]
MGVLVGAHSAPFFYHMRIAAHARETLAENAMNTVLVAFLELRLRMYLPPPPNVVDHRERYVLAAGKARSWQMSD